MGWKPAGRAAPAGPPTPRPEEAEEVGEVKETGGGGNGAISGMEGMLMGPLKAEATPGTTAVDDLRADVGRMVGGPMGNAGCGRVGA